jgi:3-dehydroquinate synthase
MRRGQTLTISTTSTATNYGIQISPGALGLTAQWARHCLRRRAKKIVVVSNRKVFGLYGALVMNSLAEAGFDATTFFMGDGERYKTVRTAESALRAFSHAGLSRTDAVVALGGGVVGDLAGFAAAIYLRGISFLQVPTTLLAMVDSSVGGKTGVNSEFGKNLVGAFHQPSGVLIDPAVLSTLPPRELTAGFCEMIKQGAVGGRALLKKTADFLSLYNMSSFRMHRDDKEFRSLIAGLIAEHVRFKAGIVRGDERESAGKTGPRSRKILNFGHTLAHALEKVTNYRYLRHGEAVGYGVLFAAEVSKSLALCGEKDVKLLYDVVHSVGPLPPLAGIGVKELFRAFSFDKKNISGSLQMVLLRGIGRPVIVSDRDLPAYHLNKVLASCLRKWA